MSLRTNDPHEPVTVTDKRRVDPETGQVREQATGPAPSGPAPEAARIGWRRPGRRTDRRPAAGAGRFRQLPQAGPARPAADRAIGPRPRVIAQLLGVLDDLDRARSHGDLESGPLKSVADKLVTALEGLGLSGFGAEGDEFDPALHEAVQHEGDGTHPVVGTVMRRGYKVGDQVVRHAMVGVVDTVPDAQGDDAAQNADTASDETAE